MSLDRLKKATIDQMVLFDPIDLKLEKIPYIFKYHYRCEPRIAMATPVDLDWELMELYRRLKGVGASPDEIRQGIEDKFIGELCRQDKDTISLSATTRVIQARS